MKVFIAQVTTGVKQEKEIKDWKRIAGLDVRGRYFWADKPEEADIILFSDSHLNQDDSCQWRLRLHPFWKKYAAKIVVYDERDWPRLPLPGLLASVPKQRFDPKIHRAAPYFRVMQPFAEPLTEKPDLLFSFVGFNSHPCRNEILNLKSPRSVVEFSGVSFFGQTSSEGEARRKKQHLRYQELLGRSKFVLCPRGAGTASFRMYEVMSAGRVPVVISDDWVAPLGPDWAACLLRVSEDEIGDLPSLLEDKESQYKQLAEAAREVYQQWFAPNVVFHTLMEQSSELLALRPNSLANRFPARLFVSSLRLWLNSRRKPG